MSGEEATRVCELHREAMMFAQDAISYRNDGDERLALQAALKAEMLERAAAMNCTNEPDRSILYRSAATLALQLGHQQEARRLAECGLEGDPPPEIADELRAVLKTCDRTEAATGTDGGGAGGGAASNGPRPVIELPDGTVLIRKGEVMPARCARCEGLYTPPPNSEGSRCPDCGQWNDHSGQKWRFVEEPEVETLRYRRGAE